MTVPIDRTALKNQLVGTGPGRSDEFVCQCLIVYLNMPIRMKLNSTAECVRVHGIVCSVGTVGLCPIMKADSL